MNDFLAHILVVDDDEGIRSLVKKYLNENQYLVNTASSAEDALEKIKIIKFDLIILDIMMPGKSGLEFIRENKKDFDTPIILLTAKGQADERVEGLEIGADDYLPKPFEPKELVLRIKNILNKTKKIVSFLTCIPIVGIGYFQYFQYSVLNTEFSVPLSYWGVNIYSVIHMFLLQILLFFLLYKIYFAKSKSDFEYTSALSKIIMLVGILVIPLNYFLHI